MTIPDLDPPATARFRRPSRQSGRLLFGVCAGLARRWHLEASTVRLAFVVTLLPLGAGLLLYAALALVMPADDAGEQSANWRGEVGRTLVQSLIVMAGVALLGGVAILSVALTFFGLVSVVLVLASAALAAVLFIDRPGVAWALGPLTVALALPAAGVALTDAQIARQFGTKVVAITSALTVEPGGYRVGRGKMLLDLRDFQAPAGSTTTINARSDIGAALIALPTDRCFNLVIDHRYLSTVLDDLFPAQNEAVEDAKFGPLPPLERSSRTPRSGVHPDLVAFGQIVYGDSGIYTRTVSDHSAPTLRLNLVTAGTAIVVRDYPRRVDPLAQEAWPLPIVGGPSAPDLDAAPALRRTHERRLQLFLNVDDTADRSAQARAAANLERANGLVSRAAIAWGRNEAGLRDFVRLTQQVRARVNYPREQAKRLVGACGNETQIRRVARAIARKDAEQQLARMVLAGLTQRGDARDVGRAAIGGPV